MRLSLFVVTAASVLLPVVLGFPSGPPPNTCEDMLPLGHLFSGAEDEDRGYILIASARTFVPGELIEVFLEGPELYRGLMIQVRDGEDIETSSAVGVWEASSDFSFVDCLTFPFGTVIGHNSRVDKPTGPDNLFFWTAPDSCTEGAEYLIRATVVQTFENVQTGIMLPITCSNSPPDPPIIIPPPPPSPSTTQPPPPPPSTTQPPPPPPSTTQPPPPPPSTTQPPPPPPSSTQPPPPPPSSTQPPPPTPSTTQPPPSTTQPPPPLPSTTQPPPPLPSTTQPPPPLLSTTQPPPPPPSPGPTVILLQPQEDRCSFLGFTNIPSAFDNSFEDGNNFLRGWIATGLNYRWVRHSGETPSRGTGPAQAADGRYYMYAESSSPANPGDVAILETGRTLRGCFCMRLDHSQAVAGRSHSFTVEVGGMEQASFTGEMGVGWVSRSFQIDVGDFVNIRLIARRGDNWFGDIGLDNIRFTRGLC